MPKAAKTVKTIKSGPLSIAVQKYADGRFGFDYKPNGGDRQKIRLSDQDAAETRARELLGAGSAGKLDLLAIDPAEFAEFLRWKASRRKVPTVNQATAAFLASKQDKGRSSWHLRDLKDTLDALTKAFDGLPIDQLTRAGVEEWLNGREVGPRRWNNLLAPITALIRFTRRDGAIDSAVHPVEGIERKFVRHTVATYAPEDLEKLLAVIPPEWIPAIALGAFSGLRPEEVCSDPRTVKESLTWESILWDRAKIDVPASVSKVGQRRFAVLTDASRAFLELSKERKGRIAPKRRISDHIKGWVKKSGVKWINDGLRHSFASYQLAMTPDLGAVALQMGNTPSILHKHYLDLKHRDEAEKWFAIRPKS